MIGWSYPLPGLASLSRVCSNQDFFLWRKPGRTAGIIREKKTQLNETEQDSGNSF